MSSTPCLPPVLDFGTINPPQAAEDSMQIMPNVAQWKGNDGLLAPSSSKMVAVDPTLAGLAWPVHGKVSSGYGMRGKGNRARMHQGIDIPVPKGTPVQASAAGTVTEARVYNGYGKTVIIDHKNGTKTLYAHCSDLAVKQGDQVKTGQVIAYAGSTGRSTTSHVHFGVMVAGTFQDPTALLKGRSQQFARKPDSDE